MNLHAIERLQDYNFSTVATTATVVSIVIIGSLYQSTSAEDRKEFFSKLCSGKTEEIDKALIYGLSIAALTIGLLEIPFIFPGYQMIYEDICYTWFPTDEQKLKKIEVHQTFKLLKAQENFRKCLLSHGIKSERIEFDCPQDCQELEREFASYGGKEAVLKLMKKFDESWK